MQPRGNWPEEAAALRRRAGPMRASLMPEPFAARLPTPFAVLGIRTAGEMLTGIE